MKRERILVADENPQCQRLLRAHLTARNFLVQTAGLGRDALTTAADFDPNLILLEARLPDISGTETCRRLREWTRAPIICLLDPEEESVETTVAVLEAGADDCVSKPLNVPELLARVNAVLRRTKEWCETTSPAMTPLAFGDLTIDLINRRVRLGDKPLHLTPTEYELLRLLATYAGRVLTHRELLIRVWGPESACDTQYLHVFVSQLRRKLEPRPDAPRYIFTEPGVGYCFAGKEEERKPGRTKEIFRDSLQFPWTDTHTLSPHLDRPVYPQDV
jgi:two-component system, OmpR family, KDP operon response regulator KdpE